MSDKTGSQRDGKRNERERTSSYHAAALISGPSKWVVGNWTAMGRWNGGGGSAKGGVHDAQVA
jgi:hypothetical protein